MASLPTNEHLEIREGGYYLAGTRVGPDVLVHDFRAGKSPEAILQAYPSIGSLAKVSGAITFVLEHPEAVEAYLAEQDELWEKLREEHPLPDEMQGRFRQIQNACVNCRANLGVNNRRRFVIARSPCVSGDLNSDTIRSSYGCDRVDAQRIGGLREGGYFSMRQSIFSAVVFRVRRVRCGQSRQLANRRVMDMDRARYLVTSGGVVTRRGISRDCNDERNDHGHPEL